MRFHAKDMHMQMGLVHLIFHRWWYNSSALAAQQSKPCTSLMISVCFTI